MKVFNLIVIQYLKTIDISCLNYNILEFLRGNLILLLRYDFKKFVAARPKKNFQFFINRISRGSPRNPLGLARWVSKKIYID